MDDFIVLFYLYIVPKPGSCPSTEGTSDQCLEQCSNDYACDGNKRCCSNGCGHVCMEPVYGKVFNP